MAPGWAAAHAHTVRASVTCTQGSEWPRLPPTPQLAVETGSGGADQGPGGGWSGQAFEGAVPELAAGHRAAEAGARSLLGLEVERGTGGEDGSSKSAQEFGPFA